MLNNISCHVIHDGHVIVSQNVHCTLSFDSVVLCLHFVYIFPHEHHRLAAEALLAIEAPEALVGPVPDAPEAMLDADDTVHGSKNLR